MTAGSGNIAGTSPPGMAEPHGGIVPPDGLITRHSIMSAASHEALMSRQSVVSETVRQSIVSLPTFAEEQLEKGGGRSSRRGGILDRLWKRAACAGLTGRRLTDELVRLSVTLTIFLAIAGLMTLAQMASDRWFDIYSRQLAVAASMPESVSALALANAPRYATDPLYDHIFTLLPDRSDMRGFLPDVLLTSFLGISLTMVLVIPARIRIECQRIVVARRILWILAFLYFFRMCSFLVTTVPNPVHKCVPKYPQDSTAYLLLMGEMATGKISACTDNIYSGHTALATVLFFSNVTYSGRGWFKIYSLFHAAAILFTILLTRLHYTVDVLIALFMTSFVFGTYHFLLAIEVDTQIFRQCAINRDHLQRVGGDLRLVEERRVFLRFIASTVLRVLWWMDGMDLRTHAPTSVPPLTQLDCEQSESDDDYETGSGGGRNHLKPRAPFISASPRTVNSMAMPPPVSYAYPERSILSI